MLSPAAISAAKKRITYGNKEAHHEHDDCIRIAYEWLDAQVKIKGTVGHSFPIKHMIEKWGGRYVSQSDVEVAAAMHPDIRGEYPRFNISSRLTRPSDARLKGISEAKTQGYEIDESSAKAYSRTE